MDFIVLIIAFAFGLFTGLVIYRAIYNERLRTVNVKIKGLDTVTKRMNLFKSTLMKMMPDEADKIFGQKFEKKENEEN